MLKFYSFILGEDYALLKADTPESRKKVSALATVIFIPVIIWFINGFLLVSSVLDKPWTSALGTGLILAIVIFLIERNIIMAQNSRSIKIFRYSLGIIIALLGAVCLDEVIFKNDIDQKLFEMRQMTIDENMKTLEDIHRIEIEKAQNDVDIKYTNWQTALNEAMVEADGSGGSGIRGVHAITRLKLAAADVSKIEYQNALNTLNSLQHLLENEKMKRKQELDLALNNSGLLIRIKALFWLVFSDYAMGFIYILFTALLFAMEFLVVFLKSAWPTSNYEKRLQAIEEIGSKRMDRILKHDGASFDPISVTKTQIKTQELLNSSTSMYN